MKKTTHLLALILLIITLQSCSSPVTQANTTIDPKLRITIKAKNDSLVVAMTNSNLKIFKALGSDDFVDHLQANTRNVVWAFREHYVKDSYSVYDEYLIKDPSVGDKIEIPSAAHGYTYTCVNEDEETYVSLLKLPFIHQDYLLSILYGHKKGGQWKINEMAITPVGRYGNTPFDFYELAKKNELKGLLFDAYFNAGTAVEWAKDVEGRIVYNNQKEMKLYKMTLERKLNDKYKFPKTLNQIATHPSITSIEVITVVEGMFPVVVYDTNVPFSNTATLEAEYESIREIVPKLYPDCNFNRDHVLFRATQVVPDPHGGTYKKTQDFMFRQTVKQ